MTNSIIIPDHVDAIVKELSQDLSTHEIWLIGSRATGNYNVSSDWDLLLFSSEEPVPKERRCEGVDALHCGPSGVILLEGQSAWMEISIKNFRWTKIDETTAKYQGQRFLDVPAGVVRNSDEPNITFTDSKGISLWSRQ
ncbi:MAG: nucleotidyltransferase domain-containing protein [Nitrosomonas sp.]|uniref:nucleotidyltransferase domain-containing protein n=1 Tax=Nitrosomonas sp. TaxID=42353 RepID=UPI0025CCEFF3|nr:nucleotidyltransferase domain-containing protein [Nitrosomonas sp.]UJP01060.1 MAG: nucleotidyltransferase domain-containing protein [Nitrosomonas sp.]UJP01803.1 MAG: nucleotidyltransferase domain-containing protein [Nitrosomonas sp.]